MDPLKDSQKTDGAIKFLDYQTLKSSSFGENRVGERAYRRAERIASAIVLLTNHIPDPDPIKVASRESVIGLLSAMLCVRDEMRSSNSASVTELKIAVRKLISMVRLLGVAGNISFQNAEIVTEALDELLSFLAASRRSSLSDSVSFSREDLIDVRDTLRLPEERKTVKPREDTEHSTSIAPAEGGPDETKRVSQRTQAILEVLRSHGEQGIREVASNLPEYSEKMIQRELADLVEVGRVKKTGLKRWSRYAYIQ